MRRGLIRVLAAGASLVALTAAAPPSSDGCSAALSQTPPPAKTLVDVMNQAIGVAQAALDGGCPQGYAIDLAPGAYDFRTNYAGLPPHGALIDVSTVNVTGSGQRLSFVGSTDAEGHPTTVIVAPRTTARSSNGFVTPQPVSVIFGVPRGGANVSHIGFRNLIFTYAETGGDTTATPDAADIVADNGLTDPLGARNNALNQILLDYAPATYGATQGIISATSEDGAAGGMWVDVATQANFPLLSDLYDPSEVGQRYLRLYDNTQPLLPLVADAVAADGATYDVGYEAPGASLTNAQAAWGETADATLPSWQGKPIPACPAAGPCTTGTVAVGKVIYHLIPPYRPSSGPPGHEIIYVPSGSTAALSSLITLQGLAGAAGVIGMKDVAAWGNAYYFDGGAASGTSSPGAQDISFRNVAWYVNARGIFLGGAAQIQVIDAIVPRPPAIRSRSNWSATAAVDQTPAISVAAGGIQIGGAEGTGSNYIRSYVAQNTGDDSLAFFNDRSASQYTAACSATLRAGCVSTVTSTTIMNSFARSILLDNTKGQGASNVNVSGPDATSSITVTGTASGGVADGTETIYTESAGLNALSNRIVTGNGGLRGCQAYRSEYAKSLTYPLPSGGGTLIPSLLCGIFYKNG